jgi:hypothetical protein
MKEPKAGQGPAYPQVAVNTGVDEEEALKRLEIICGKVYSFECGIPILRKLSGVETC